MTELFPGAGPEPVVIAEIGGNHGGDYGLAVKMVDAAAEAGAQAVKFQTYLTEELVAPTHESYDAFAGEALSFEQFTALATHCRERNVVFLSTPFGIDSADFLEGMSVPAFKIASGDLTYHQLLRHIAAKGRPAMLSTGAANWDQIDRAVSEFLGITNEPSQLILMHCTAAYPAADAEANLLLIPELRQRYRCPVGFSDHTLGIGISMAAVALGAQIVEKHFTIDQTLPGGDNDISILPAELGELVVQVKRISSALGSDVREPTPSERELIPIMRRSLVVRRRVDAGAQLDREDLSIVRPGGGLAPGLLDAVIGRRTSRSLEPGDLLSEDDLDP